MSTVSLEFDPTHFDVWYSLRGVGLVDALERYRGCEAGRLYSGTVAKAYKTYANWASTQDPTDWLKAGMLCARPPVAYGRSSDEFWSTELGKVFRRR